MSKYLSLLAVGLLFGVFGVLINYNSEMFGDYFQVFTRNAGALMLLLPIIFYKKIKFQFKKSEYKWLAFYSLLVVIAFTTVTLAYVNADIKVVIAVRYFVTLLLSFLVSAIYLREKAGATQFLSLIMALVGIILFSYPLADFWSVGVLFAAVTAAGFLSANYIIKMVPLKAEALMFVEFLSVSTLLGVLIIATGSPVVIGYSTVAILSSLAFPILLVLVTYMIIYGFRGSNFNLANIMMTSEIAFGILLGYLALGQTISKLELFGVVLIALAVILPNVLALIKKQNEI